MKEEFIFNTERDYKKAGHFRIREKHEANDLSTRKTQV